MGKSLDSIKASPTESKCGGSISLFRLHSLKYFKALFYELQTSNNERRITEFM
jgi:hypothetical protein